MRSCLSRSKSANAFSRPSDVGIEKKSRHSGGKGSEVHVESEITRRSINDSSKKLVRAALATSAVLIAKILARQLTKLYGGAAPLGVIKNLCPSHMGSF